MAPSPPPDPSVFVRDRLTILVYTMAGTFGYSVGALGPAMPLLRDDLGIGRTVGGLHFTVVASGAVAFGFFLERLAQRWGRRRLFWRAAILVASGALLIGVGPHPAVTLLGAALIGGPGAAVLSTVQSTLSDRHHRHRAVALTEGNTASSAGSVVAALVMGAFVAIGIGWRWAFVVPALLVAATAAFRSDEPFPPADRAIAHRQGRRLPAAYWLFWAALFPAVAAEWSLGAWGAGYLVDIGGTSEAAAAVLMTLFFGAMVLGRLVASRLARRLDPLAILMGSAVLGLIGILVFWRADPTGLIVAGLVTAGLGISTLFPMLLSMAVEVASDRADVATARVSISAGAAVIVAPITLGWLADRNGIQQAFGIVPGLFVLVVVIAIAGRAAARPAPHASIDS